MRFRKYSATNTKAYLLTSPGGIIIVSGAVSQEKNYLIAMKIYKLFQDRLSDQEQYDSEVISEETSWVL